MQRQVTNKMARFDWLFGLAELARFDWLFGLADLARFDWFVWIGCFHWLI